MCVSFIHVYIYIHTYIHPSIHPSIHTYRQTDRQAGRQADRQTDILHILHIIHITHITHKTQITHTSIYLYIYIYRHLARALAFATQSAMLSCQFVLHAPSFIFFSVSIPFNACFHGPHVGWAVPSLVTTFHLQNTFIEAIPN